MILTLGHTKGGVGKSTLALNIAIERLRAGVDTLLIDGDPRQTSISKAIGLRADGGIDVALVDAGLASGLGGERREEAGQGGGGRQNSGRHARCPRSVGWS